VDCVVPRHPAYVRRAGAAERRRKAKADPPGAYFAIFFIQFTATTIGRLARR